MLKNLKTLRGKRQISQQRLAEVIGVSQQSVNKYENHDVEPDIATLIKLADYFDTTVDYLIGRTDTDCVTRQIEPYHLNRDEMRIMDGYRLLDPKQKQSIKLILENYTADK